MVGRFPGSTCVFEGLIRSSTAYHRCRGNRGFAFAVVGGSLSATGWTSLPQKRHRIAASCICSAQKGQARTIS
jgi:hypothetical protein